MTFPIVGSIKKLSSFCPYSPGLYTDAQVDDLILIDGYIPVYDAAEFDKIRTGAVETMGGCTRWGGEYTTGGDKKYIQVGVVDLSVFSTGTGFDPITSSSLEYDGNEININNLFIDTSGSNTGLFTMPSIASTDIKLKNIRLNNVDVTGGSNTAALCGFYYENTASGGDSIIENCMANGVVSGTSFVGGLIGRAGGTNSSVPATNITNSHFTGIVNATSSNVGGFVGLFTQTGAINDCSASANVNGVTSGTGGFVGISNIGMTISRCKQNGDVTVTTGGVGVGGFVGQLYSGTSSIIECESSGTVTASNSDWVGGFAGVMYFNALTQNCYSNGNVIGGSQVGGFVGRRGGAGSRTINCYCVSETTGSSSVGGFGGANGGGTNIATNCYFDSDVFGSSSTYTGTPQTTSALQTPTSNTGIYSAWSLAVWDFGTSVEYPSLINTP